jgi:hypothetical protein
MSPRASFEKSPFVAWHSGRQNSTGRATSFCVIAYTGRPNPVWNVKIAKGKSVGIRILPETEQGAWQKSREHNGNGSRGNVKTAPPFVRRGGQKVGHPQFQNQKRRPIKYTNGLAPAGLSKSSLV